MYLPLYVGVCDVYQNKTTASSGAAPPCGALHHGAVCGPRHVCTSAGACAEDLALGLPAAMADPRWAKRSRSYSVFSV